MARTDALLASLSGLQLAFTRSALRYTNLYPLAFRRANEAELLSTMLDSADGGADHVSLQDGMSIAISAVAWSWRHSPPLGLRMWYGWRRRPLPPQHEEWALDRLAKRGAANWRYLALSLAIVVGLALYESSWTQLKTLPFWLLVMVVAQRKWSLSTTVSMFEIKSTLARYGQFPDGTDHPIGQFVAVARGAPPALGSVSVTASFLALQAFAGAALLAASVWNLGDTRNVGWVDVGPGHAVELGSAVIQVAVVTATVSLAGSVSLVRWMRSARCWWQRVPCQRFRTVSPWAVLAAAIWWIPVAVFAGLTSRREIALAAPLITTAVGIAAGCWCAVIAVVVARFERSSPADGRVGIATFAARWQPWRWYRVERLDYRAQPDWHGPPCPWD